MLPPLSRLPPIPTAIPPRTSAVLLRLRLLPALPLLLPHLQPFAAASALLLPRPLRLLLLLPPVLALLLLLLPVTGAGVRQPRRGRQQRAAAEDQLLHHAHGAGHPGAHGTASRTPVQHAAVPHCTSPMLHS